MINKYRKGICIMKKIFGIFLFLIVFLVSCNKQPFDEIAEESIQPTLRDSEQSDFQVEDKINPIVEVLFVGESEKLTFDNIIKSISNDSMNWELIYESRTDAEISKEDDVYYPVNSNLYSDTRISPLDTFTEILNNCEYIETAALNEPVVYTFIFHAIDINGVKNEICVLVSRSCVKFAYNGISDGKEYANITVCDEYDSYINGIIPDENGQRATIW